MKHRTEQQIVKVISRRNIMAGTVAAVTTVNLALGGKLVMAGTVIGNGEEQMTPKAFVYTELQISAPFENVPWQELNDQIANEPGFLNKTWFSGVGNNSVGGIYSFESVEAPQHYCTTFFPAAAKKFGVAQTTRVFDAGVVSDASRDMGSPHFGAVPTQTPGAFVYTEVQVNVPFEKAPWQDRNPVLKQQKGLISKLWLSGLDTNTLGGVDAFDTVGNALAFAVEVFPRTAAKLNAAFYTRVFDASVAEAASRGLHSPYYT
jgi:hypothetical protein